MTPAVAANVATGAIAASLWCAGPLKAISTLINAEYPDGSGEAGAQWHISFSSGGKRLKDREATRALRAFDLLGAEEDNHHPGIARNFWMPLDPARRVDCECKTTEIQHVEPDGFRWSDDPDNCRGCELERLTGKPCGEHAATRGAA